MYRYILSHSIEGSITLATAPQGWDDLQLTYTRSDKYYSVLRSATAQLKFAGDGYDWLDNIISTYGYDLEISCLIKIYNPLTFAFETFFDGIFDLKTYKKSELFIELNCIDGLFLQKLMNRDTNEIAYQNLITIDGDEINPNPNEFETITVRGIYKDTTCEAVYPYELFERIITSITGYANAFTSSLFGRSTYFKGEQAYRMITIGNYLKEYSSDKVDLTISLERLFQSFNAMFNLGLGHYVEDGKDYVVVENKRYFFDETVILTIENLSDLEYSLDETNLYGSVIAGYSKIDTENKYGQIEYNNKAEYATPLKAFDKALTLISDIRADGTAIEKLRTPEDYTEPTTETNETTHTITVEGNNDGTTDVNTTTDLTITKIVNIVDIEPDKTTTITTTTNEIITEVSIESGITTTTVTDSEEIATIVTVENTDSGLTISELTTTSLDKTKTITIGVVVDSVETTIGLETISEIGITKTTNNTETINNGTDAVTTVIEEIITIEPIVGETTTITTTTTYYRKTITTVNLSGTTTKYESNDETETIEEVNETETSTNKTENDDSLFVISCYDDSGALKSIEGEGFDELSGITGEKTIKLNCDLSPARMVKNNGEIISIGQQDYRDKYLTFQNATTDSELVTRKTGEAFDTCDCSNISIRDLSLPYLSGEIANFNAPVGLVEIMAIEENRNGIIKFYDYINNSYKYGWIKEISTNPVDKTTNWSLLMASNNVTINEHLGYRLLESGGYRLLEGGGKIINQL